MSALMPRLLDVSASAKTASFASISAALLQAVTGDTVVVGPGRYSPSQTGERFPLYVPPGVTLAGIGQDDTIIDGEGAMDLSFRPLCEGQSLVLLGDASVLSGFAVVNGGGNGISNQLGAHVLITRNAIHGHGQHGILVSGPQEALIKDNIFLDNGTKRFSPTTPRGVPGRQGHHIFVQGKGGLDNRVIIADNTMTRAYADGIAMVVFFDEPDGVRMQVSVIDNLIEHSERRGLTIAASFSSPGHRVMIDVRRNIIRDNTEYAIVAGAARPLATTLIRDSYLRLQVFDNECRNSAEGIALFGGFGPAEGNQLDATVVGNLIGGMKGHAVRVIGGIGYHRHAAHENRVRALISRNRVEEVGGTPIFIQGGVSEAHEEATGNEVLARVHDNELPTVSGKPSIMVNDGLLGNAVHLEEPFQAHERVGGVTPFHM
jgi:parallel beta helix pectate lyase-like protein